MAMENFALLSYYIEEDIKMNMMPGRTVAKGGKCVIHSYITLLAEFLGSVKPETISM